MITYAVEYSYGSPDRRLTDNGYFCNQYGYIAYDDYGVQYSYGKIAGLTKRQWALGLCPNK